MKPQPAFSLLVCSSGGCTECTWDMPVSLVRKRARFVCMYLISSFYDFFTLFCVCTHMCHSAHVEVSSFTMWLLGLELSMSGLTASACTR